MNSFVLVLIFVVNSFVSAQTITGTFISRRTNKPLEMSMAYLIDAKTGITIQEKGVDENGRFRFDSVRAGTYHIATLVRYSSDTIKNIAITKDTTLKLFVGKTCVYDKSIRNKRCPKCHKRDQTIPISYGLPIYDEEGYPKSVQLSDGEFIMVSKNGKQFYDAGCEITDCDPNWYCKRDKTKF